MIDYIKGELTFVEPHMIVIEAAGIGYQIQVGNPYVYAAHTGQELTVFTYQHVREDILALYGFKTREQRLLFEKLLLVSGIGPKVALSIMSTDDPRQVITAIQNEDVTYLTGFPGIGKKTAQRIILDLKDKLDDVAASFIGEVGLVASGDQPHTEQQERSAPTKQMLIAEALEVLRALGYVDKEVQAIVPRLKELASDEWDAERYVKQGLQLLMK